MNEVLNVSLRKKSEWSCHHITSLLRFEVLRNAVLSPIDFRLLKKLTRARKLHAELAVKQRSGFHWQRNAVSKFIRF